MEIVVALDRHEPAVESSINLEHVALFCTPAVNLFPKRVDRIHLSDSDHEYHVVADRSRPLDFEVHSILDVTGFGTKGDARRDVCPVLRVARDAGVTRGRRPFSRCSEGRD